MRWWLPIKTVPVKIKISLELINIVFMKKSVFIIICVAFFCSCDDSNKEQIKQIGNIALLEKENELLKKEIFLDSLKNALDNKSKTETNTVLSDEKGKSIVSAQSDDLIRLGKHLISLQWITTDITPNGSVNISKLGHNKYKIEGGQKSMENSDYLHINGTFILNGKNELLFEGTLIYKVEHNNSGLPCDKSGNLFFKATNNRKYWRMQQMENCEGGMLTDYVDIYF